MNEKDIIFILIILFAVEIFIWLTSRNLNAKKPPKLVSQDLVPDQNIHSKAYFSRKYMLKGRPDKVEEINGDLIPFEYKSSFSGNRAYPSHVNQLIAYCILLEEDGNKPPYGILQYRDQDFTIPYTKRNKERVLKQMERIRLENPEEDDLPPLCSDKKKCKHCGYAYICYPE